VWAKTGALDDPGSIRGFLVPTNTPGFSAKDQRGKLSLRASDTSEIVLQDVRVPREALLPKSAGLKAPLSCLTAARYGIAWGALGSAMACYDEAVSYAKTRVMFGKPIGGFQLQQARLAEMLTEITKGQLLCLQLGRLKDQGKMTPSRSRSPSKQRQHGDRCRARSTAPARRQRHPGRVSGDAASRESRVRVHV
jgi:glutaryl-CoA dehydrogenase